MTKKLEFYLHQHIYNIVNKKYKNNDYKYKWTIDKSTNKDINTFLKIASKNINKNKKQNTGKPDLIYYNDDTRLLILVEIKSDKKKHSSNSLGLIKEPKNFAVDGVLHYASFFNDYNIIAIAISGNIDDFLIDQFLIKENDKKPIHIPAQRILNEFDYENIVSDNLINKKIDNLSSVLSSLNKDMDNYKIDVSKRPIILGAIIFSLTSFKQVTSDIEKLKYNSSNISKSLMVSIKKKMESILPKSKWEDNTVMIDRFCKLIDSYSINNGVWKIILKKVDENLMPIIHHMKKESYHDFSGDMYRTLLRYTSGDGKILGQVLTPKHIANLMIELAELKRDDSILDPACGTGIFLVNSMNKLISMSKSENEINEIKSKKIYGIEISKEMFFLTLVNMLINNDGKTNIYVDDNNSNIDKRGIFAFNKNDFKEQPKKIIMNPPYLSHNEMWKFILKSMELGSEKSVIIIPTSILNNNKIWKQEFLKNHSLEAVFNMPGNIFQNKSSSGSQVKTSILVSKIGVSNKKNYQGTYLYNLEDDGFISSKKHGRFDGNNKWNLIKDKLLNSYRLRTEIEGVSKNIKNISADDSWHFNYFNKVDIKDFHKINDYLLSFLYSIIDKKKMSNIKKEFFKANLIAGISVKNFKINAIGFIPAVKLLSLEKNYNSAFRIEKYSEINGDISYVSAAKQNNGSRLNNTRNIYNETIFSDKITWNTQGDGGAGLAFYHPYKFIVGSTSLVCDTKESLTFERKLFLTFAMSLEKKNRYHGNSITKKQFLSKGLTIAMPVKETGEINWELIVDFMNTNNIVKKIKKELLNQNHL